MMNSLINFLCDTPELYENIDFTKKKRLLKINELYIGA